MEERAESSGPPPRRGSDGLFLFLARGRGDRRNGWREWAQGWRLAEDDRRQRCAGLVGSLARIGGQFNGWLSTMPVTAGLCAVYCVRTASVWCRAEGARRLLLEAGRRAAEGRERAAEGRRQRGSAQVGAGNSAKAIREPGAFRWFGSAVRRSGGQAAFDGAVFTAKGEG